MQSFGTISTFLVAKTNCNNGNIMWEVFKMNGYAVNIRMVLVERWNLFTVYSELPLIRTPEMWPPLYSGHSEKSKFTPEMRPPQ